MVPDIPDLSLQDYRLLFKEMLSGFALHDLLCDEQGKPVDYRFLAVNPAFERLTGLSAPDVIGRTVREVIPDIEESWIETYGAVCLTGIPRVFEMQSGPLGKRFEVTAYRPAPGQFACVFADVTARLAAQEQMARSQDELREFLGYLQEIREEDRRAVGRELHDDLGQQLTGLVFDLETIRHTANLPGEVSEHVATMTERMKTALGSLRRLCTSLRPRILDDLGLLESISWLCDDFQSRSSIPCSLTRPAVEPDLSDSTRTGIFRIIQESLNNIIKHAQAQSVQVRILESPWGLEVLVKDDGIGLPFSTTDGPYHFGLTGMRERALAAGGTLDLISAPQAGTTVRVTVPLAGTLPQQGSQSTP